MTAVMTASIVNQMVELRWSHESIRSMFALNEIVERLSENLSTSNEFIQVFNALWQGAGSAGHMHRHL